MIDVSDGLLADLGHVAHRASGVRTIDLDATSTFEIAEAAEGRRRRDRRGDPLVFLLTGGDDHAAGRHVFDARVPPGWRVIGRVGSASSAGRSSTGAAPVRSRRGAGGAASRRRSAHQPDPLRGGTPRAWGIGAQPRRPRWADWSHGARRCRADPRRVRRATAVAAAWVRMLTGAADRQTCTHPAAATSRAGGSRARAGEAGRARCCARPHGSGPAVTARPGPGGLVGLPFLAGGEPSVSRTFPTGVGRRARVHRDARRLRRPAGRPGRHVADATGW